MAGQWWKYKLEMWAVAETLPVSDHLILNFVIPQPSAHVRCNSRLSSHCS